MPHFALPGARTLAPPRGATRVSCTRPRQFPTGVIIPSNCHSTWDPYDHILSYATCAIDGIREPDPILVRRRAPLALRDHPTIMSD